MIPTNTFIYQDPDTNQPITFPKPKISRLALSKLITLMDRYEDPSEFAKAAEAEYGDPLSTFADSFMTDVRLAALREFFVACHMPIREIYQRSDFPTKVSFAEAFSVPLRAFENWCAPEDSPSHRECPFYVKLLIIETLGLLPFDIVSR